MEEIISQIKLQFKSDHPNKWGIINNQLKILVKENRLDLLNEIIFDCEMIFDYENTFNEAPEFVGYMFLIDPLKGKEWLSKAVQKSQYSANYLKLAVIAYQNTEDIELVLELINNIFLELYMGYNDEKYDKYEMPSIMNDYLYDISSIYINGKEGIIDENLKMLVKPLFKEAFDFLEEELEAYEYLISFLEEEDFGFSNEKEWIERLNEKI